MIEISQVLKDKHLLAIEAARNYYVLNKPTGLLDSEYDKLESEARKDGIELRDYVTQEIQGKRSMNASYIAKVEKCQVDGNMLEALKDLVGKNEYKDIVYEIPKYDGSSLAAYYDVNTGKCIKVITVGGSNLGGEGIDQTEKFARFFPDLPGTGICALQAECLVSLEHGFGENSRQKANGLVNAAYVPMSYSEFVNNSTKQRTKKEYSVYYKKFKENQKLVEQEVDKYINIRCFRYFLVPGSPDLGDYKQVLNSLPKIYNSEGDCKFSGGYVLDHKDLGDFVNTDIWKTPTGTFLVDGVVGYTSGGICVKAFKYKDAGRGEVTEVLGIKWNNQITKGKDSWSANAIINPIVIRGSEIKKPSVGSIKKMVERGLSKGAKVSVILVNSTIPQVSEVKTPGNLDYEFPTCSCGYKMSDKDIYGILLKCGNPDCSERFNRMTNYLNSCNVWVDIDLNKLLILDRFDWYKKVPSYKTVLMPEILEIVYNNYGVDILREYLSKYLSTPLQIKNLNLVITPAYKSLRNYVIKNFNGTV